MQTQICRTTFWTCHAASIRRENPNSSDPCVHLSENLLRECISCAASMCNQCRLRNKIHFCVKCNICQTWWTYLWATARCHILCGHIMGSRRGKAVAGDWIKENWMIISAQWKLAVVWWGLAHKKVYKSHVEFINTSCLHWWLLVSITAQIILVKGNLRLYFIVAAQY